MKATYAWIREFVPGFTGSVEEMCERFTMSGTEVESWEQVGDDWVIEFAVTSNRVDCLGIVGLGRELAAATGLAFVPPDCTAPEGSDPAIDEVTSVVVEDSEGCPRYTAHVIEGVTVGPSPQWLVRRLEALGLRSVNNVVDATNYVLFEMNQPFHAFDLDKLEGERIIVRKAREGDRIVAINGKEYRPEPDMCVIADASRPVAIAGVMGGLDTEVGASTRRILLETAVFDPASIRSASRRLGLVSDSSFRFERGVDPETVLDAARRCARRILELAGGELRRGVIDADAHERRTVTIPFRPSEVERICGVAVPWERCREILTSLACGVEGDPAVGVGVKAPSWRPDLTREIDLVEEVIRIHGLENVPGECSMTVAPVKEPREERVKTVILDRLRAAGFSETLTTSFVSEDEARFCFFAGTAPVTIDNAMRSDENALRQSLAPSLLRVRKTNQDRGNDDVRLAECTVVYLQRDAAAIPEHLPIVGGLVDGDYRLARGVLESLAEGLGLEFSFGEPNPEALALLDPDGAATVRVGDVVAGYLGRPRPGWLDRYDLKASPYLFELRRDVLVEHAGLTPCYRPLSRFPGVSRDLAIVVDEETPWGAVAAAIEALQLPDLEEISFFDEYRGKQVPAGKKSLAFSMMFRSSERTLTGAEVDAAMSRVIEVLARDHAAEIRGA